MPRGITIVGDSQAPAEQPAHYQLRHAVVVLDVGDVEGFVRDTLDKSGIEFERQEFEELVLEGIAIMYELAAAYKPRLEGYDCDGRFNGYAAFYLPKRLSDAWHRNHPEHKYVTDPDTGKRRWVYLKRTISIEVAMERRGGDEGEASYQCETHLLPSSKWVPVAAS